MEYALVIYVYGIYNAAAGMALTNIPMQNLETCKIAAIETVEQLGKTKEIRTACVKVK